MRKTNLKLIIVLISSWLIDSSAFAASQYARDCERVIGVPIPDVDCSDPRGSSVPVGTREGGRCDTPSHGLSHCNPGTRFIKYEDTFTRNGRTEKVTTMIMCRKTDGDISRRPRNRDVYSDIGVIQYNETKHATCWFSKTSDGRVPTKNVNGRRVYPSPTTENTPPEFWGNSQPDSKCISCHQSGVWLRSPFAMGVQAERGKGYKRNGLTAAYEPGDGNNIPENNQQIAQRGLTCSVGIPDWNRADGVTAPLQVKINADAYDRKFPQNPNLIASASSASCTRCHYFGVGDAAYTRRGEAGRMACDTFLPEVTTGSNSLRRAGASFAQHYWMPPGKEGAISTAEQFTAQYGRALGALEWCCNRENRNDEDYRSICTTDKFTRNSGEESRVLNALNVRGACALCPDCTEAEERNKPLRNH